MATITTAQQAKNITQLENLVDTLRETLTAAEAALTASQAAIGGDNRAAYDVSQYSEQIKSKLVIAKYWLKAVR